MYKQESNGDNQTPFFDSLCTCKECSHDLAKDCVNADCNCCKEGTHSMVLNGMAGFEPARQKDRQDSEWVENRETLWYQNTTKKINNWVVRERRTSWG